MIRLEKRRTISKFWTTITPVVAVFLTMLFGGLMFGLLLGDLSSAFGAIKLIFWDPIFDENFASYARPQLLVKAGPIILIAIGLSIGFKAGIWNIGAEGQYILGAIFGASVALSLYPQESVFIFPAMILAGALGGFIWALIPALLKVYFKNKRNFGFVNACICCRKHSCFCQPRPFAKSRRHGVSRKQKFSRLPKRTQFRNNC